MEKCFSILFQLFLFKESEKEINLFNTTGLLLYPPENIRKA